MRLELSIRGRRRFWSRPRIRPAELCRYFQTDDPSSVPLQCILTIPSGVLQAHECPARRYRRIKSSDDLICRSLIPKMGSLGSVQLDGGAAPPHLKYSYRGLNPTAFGHLVRSLSTILPTDILHRLLRLVLFIETPVKPSFTLWRTHCQYLVLQLA